MLRSQQRKKRSRGLYLPVYTQRRMSSDYPDIILMKMSVGETKKIGPGCDAATTGGEWTACGCRGGEGWSERGPWMRRIKKTQISRDDESDCDTVSVWRRNDDLGRENTITGLTEFLM